MKAAEVIKQILAERGIRKTELGRACGARRQIIEKRLSNRDMETGTMVKMLNGIGYKVYAVPATVAQPRGSYEITAPEEEE